jgi:Uma2 family endonuclease
LLARLLEAFADHHELPLNGLGSTTFRNKAKKVGLEPDECYVLGDEKAVPDLAIEAVLTSGSVDKLEAYRRLGVREVWFWVKGKIHLFKLSRRSYEEIPGSALLPGLDVRGLERILAATPVSRQAAAVRSFRRSLSR